jgi:hypothetical protein
MTDLPERIYLKDYPFTGLTGAKYIPYRDHGQWYIMPLRQVSFEDMCELCDIPADVAIMIRLRY